MTPIDDGARGRTMLSLSWIPLLAAGTAPDTTFAVQATRVHVEGGNVIENATVVVSGGKVREVGTALALEEDVPLLEFEGELSAGLVALSDRSGSGAEALDSTRMISPGMDLSWAHDADHSQVRGLVEEGITTVVLTPGWGNLVGGLAAVVKPGERVLERGALLAIDLSSTGLRSNRYPTSYAGAYEALEERFSSATPGDAFGRAAGGELPVFLTARSRAEIDRALAFATERGLRGYLATGSRAGELAERIRASELGVALPPRSPSSTAFGARSAVQLAAAGVPFGFALDGPSYGPATLRFTAAAAVRAGLDRAAALRALTSDAAGLAGVGDRVGRIAVGMDADLVLWSADPVDPGSRVLAVWIDGKRVVTHEVDDDEDDEEEEED